ncbi:hypothetical protein JL475_32880, partial [Streptomyces sp. M2CJ-2]|uniref:phosphopantetheine-binding protein n=1 Tax=Streptomyces sp. M2CJ-2 TaxID=2803948 RepID=UPI001A460A4B
GKLRGLVRPTRRQVRGGATGAGFWAGLAELPAAERQARTVDLVRGMAASVLGHAEATAIDPARGFLESGFDSLSAIEFRNRLDKHTGRRLPATLIFDYPSPHDLAHHLLTQFHPENEEDGDPTTVLEKQLLALEKSFADTTLDQAGRTRIVSRLHALTAAWSAVGESEGPHGHGTSLDSASAEDLFSILDDELHSPE